MVLPEDRQNNAGSSIQGDPHASEFYVAYLQSLIAELLEKNQRMRQQLLRAEMGADRPGGSQLSHAPRQVLQAWDS